MINILRGIVSRKVDLGSDTVLNCKCLHGDASVE